MKNITLIFLVIFNSSLFAQDSTFITVQDSTYIFVQQPTLPDADSIAHLKHHHPLPLECSKIKAGYSHHSRVLNLYGKGLFNDKEGHGGARYFIDSLKKVILKTVIGVDSIIEEVGLSSYDYPFDFVNDKITSIPVAKKLNVNPLMIGAIHLGDPEEKVIRVFGVPNQVRLNNDVRSVVYEDTNEEWSDVLFYSAIFEFKKNKLKRIVIYNGD